MEVLFRSCCELDVPARTVVACLVKEGHKTTRTFSTMTGQLLGLVNWLVSEQCQQVAIESTGVYWCRVFNGLEGLMPVMLVNAEKHSTLRAQTRDEERPKVAIILLTHDEAQSINLGVIPNREISEFLIRREVKISRSGLTQAILANPELKKNDWEKNALLQHHRLIVLDENKKITIGYTTLILDNELGVTYENEGGRSE